MANKITSCIVPAAGKGSRWAPISGYLPKEMLPLVDKPVIEWILGEIINSGITKIIVIINKNKEIIREYINNSKLPKRADIVFSYQESPLGLADVLRSMEHEVTDEYFAMALPDLPTISKTPVLKQLIKTYQKQNKAVHLLSFSKFPPQYRNLYSECLLKKTSPRLYEVEHFCVKVSDTKPHHKNQKIRMSGRYIFRRDIFDAAESIFKEFKGTELNEVDSLNYALKNSKIMGYEIQGHTYDTGMPQLYVRANTAFFKKYISKRI